MPTTKLRLGNREIIVELPQLATQANGEALVRLGDTVVLVTVVMASTPREGVDFFPLMVEFEEKYYAAGALRSSRFMKREAKPSDEAMISGRLVDRTIRPRFPKGMRNEVQVVATTLSYDGENDPDVLAIIGASTALLTSDIPWEGPIAGVRVADVEGELVLNPIETERRKAKFELIVAGTEDRVNMLEGAAKEVPEGALLEAIEKGHEAVRELSRELRAFAEEHGKPKKVVVRVEPSQEARAAIRAFLGKRLEETLFSTTVEKQERMAAVNALKRELIDHFTAGDALAPREIDTVFEDEIDRIVHERAVERAERPDGRSPEEVRSLASRVGYLPRTHGSAIFTRGNTTALATVTLASRADAQIVEGMEGEWRKPFMLHYNFPPYSVGDVKPMRGPGRREIGHGALAERSISAVIPSAETFPYTIRVVSEILSSNGSSSMATTCAASLALMDAGVPITRHVAGIAMGIMVAQDGRYRILTDIQGPEDHHGDMDLKITGTHDGIAGIQMDVKIEGVTTDMLREAFTQARRAHEEILGAMERTIAQPRPSVAAYAPKVVALTIPQEKIRDIIGPGGRVINGIIARTGAQIDVEDSGDVYITAIDPQSVKRAEEEVRSIVREAEVGERFEGTVTRLFPFGVMVEIFPNHEGLVHMNDLPHGIRRPEDAFRIGMALPVLVKEIDGQGRVNLSLAEPENLQIQEGGGGEEFPRRDHRPRPGGGNRWRPRRP